ncbi:PREDICTED: putative B3 domain-containing protein At1g78640 [Camelina sativa]|uniref:B3 domain-containing protein At1g78640 n=1 Tax=Camelina sativa TaxID=90675 RepID=A0ABM1R301_CAMSA|nr:PREDICTED: putative B3 domain-containing protein At1g78640 [Camelina sativa]
MAEEQWDIPHANYLSLGMGPYDTTAISPTKKKEGKPLRLFGNSIFPAESSSDDTAMALVDVPTSSEKTLSSFEVELESSEETHNKDSLSLELSLGISGSCTINSNVTCAGIKKNITKDARKSKKRRSLSKEEKRAARVLAEVPHPHPWTMAKTLSVSDVNGLSRLMLNTVDAETHIVSHLPTDVQENIQQGIGIEITAYDQEKGTEHKLVIKRHVNTSKSYVLNGGWSAVFSKRKKLVEGDTIGLFWNNTNSRLHVGVLQRKKDEKDLVC